MPTSRFFSGFTLLAMLFAFGQPAPIAAQSTPQESKPAASKPDDAKPAADAESEKPKEEASSTDHTIQLGGQTIPYKATASTIMLKDDKGDPTALIFSTAYTRSDVKDPSKRPIAFIYNGGPGSASIWLHMGAFGPKYVVTENASATPPAPYKVEDNADCLLDKADLVFIDPVGTGFSHAAGKAQDKDFWGVDSDVKSLAQFISIYVSRNNRWNSPKFLMGESYGTFRSVALGNYLQTNDGMYINGIVLISSVLDLGSLSFSPGDDQSYILYLPTYAAVAWYYKVLKDRPDDLDAFLADARKFASTDYAAALMKGSKLGDAEKSDIVAKLEHFTGLSEDYLRKAELRVALPQFTAELERSRGLTVGRYDARFSGPTYDLLTEYAETDPSFTGILGAFTAAFNSYVREDLKFGQDKTYKVLPSDPSRNWDWKHNQQAGSWPGAANVEGDLIREMIDNPHLQIQVEDGFFDLATPFFATEFTMDHLLLPGDLGQNIHLEYYQAGHMMYLHQQDHDKLAANVRAFIESASKK